MRSIVPELTDELLEHFEDPNKVGAAEPFFVKTFRELVIHTAKLSYKNKDHLLFYRGQDIDYKNKAGNSSFYPSIYRGDLQSRELFNRFEILDGASTALINLFESKRIEGYKELKRRNAVQWSILQHYGVCDTPFLDFTHSLRVACSFAMLNPPNQKIKSEFAYVFVFGLPYLTNRISINSEQDIINVRLLSICPLSALRPYFQEGYLAGTDGITTNYDSKTELDFSNRLIAKFQLKNDDLFWSEGFDKIHYESLYPKEDSIWEICQEIKDLATRELQSGDLGEFLKSWAELERILVSQARTQYQKVVNLNEATKNLRQNQRLNDEQAIRIDRLRHFRNTLVHTPDKISSGALKDYILMLRLLIPEIKETLNWY